jgi:predicted dehydrogenase
MNKLKTAVIGTGHLGKFHARVLNLLNSSDFKFVVDVDEEKGKEVANKYNTDYVKNYKDIVNNVDAVTIATPTVYHFEIAKFFIENKKHVLIEKPITVEVEHANKLIKLAKENNVKLQVGHIERFNRAYSSLKENLKKPDFIKTFRLSPFTGRSVDIDVILDLMIHDVDLVFALEKSEVKGITVKGTKVLSQKTDIAFAVIEFASGSVAELNVSRVSAERERSIRVYDTGNNCYFSADLNKRELNKFSYKNKELQKEQIQVEDRDQLEAEIGSFLNAILQDKQVEVTGEDGLKALTYTKIISDMAATGKCRTEF